MHVLLSFFTRTSSLVTSLLCSFLYSGRFTNGADPYFIGLPRILITRDGQIHVGSRLKLNSIGSLNSIYGIQPVFLRSIGGQIIIGDDVGISSSSISCRSRIVIGNGTLVGSGCIITDNDAHGLEVERRVDGHAVRSKPVIIGKNCFIGARSIILKGVVLGDNVVVGAGSVVTKSFPKDCIVAGNPARFLSLNDG